MLFQGRINRAQKTQKEENMRLHPSDYISDDPDSVIEKTRIDQEVEKGDVKAMVLSAYLVIFGIGAAVLIFLVVLALLLFRLL